jgi:hypothetical protein
LGQKLVLADQAAVCSGEDAENIEGAASQPDRLSGAQESASAKIEPERSEAYLMCVHRPSLRFSKLQKN